MRTNGFFLNAFSVLALLALAGCEDTASGTDLVAGPTADPDLAASEGEPPVAEAVVDPVQPSDTDALWQSFLRVERGGEPGAPLTLEQMQAICETARDNGMSMKGVVAAHGLPQSWLNNYGQIESASWTVAPNNRGILSLSIYYSRAGAIRNVAYTGSSMSFRGGISDWMTVTQRCVPGVTFDG